MSKKRKAEHADGEAAGSADHEQTHKKPRPYSKDDAELAAIYARLGEEMREVQISAAVDLVRHYKTADYPDKVLVRLIRGLCSSRKASRLGFFIALVEVIKAKVDNAPGSDTATLILAMVKANTAPETSASKAERKDHLLGRLSAISAILHSRIALKDNTFEELITISIEIGQQSLPLSEQCGKFWSDIVHISAETHNHEEARVLLRLLNSNGILNSANGVAIWIKCRQFLSKKDLPKGFWHHNDPLTSEELQRLKKVLLAERIPKNTQETKTSNDTQTSEASARREPHFVYKLIFEQFSDSAEPGSSVYSEKRFRAFWSTAVDGVYFGPDRSPERKYLGLKLFQQAIGIVTASFVKHVFSKNATRCLVNQYADGDRLLHGLAEASVDSIVARLQSHYATRRPTDTAYGLLSQVIGTFLAVENVAENAGTILAKSSPITRRLLQTATLEDTPSLLEIYLNATIGASKSKLPKSQLKIWANQVGDQISILSKLAPETRPGAIPRRADALSLLSRFAFNSWDDHSSEPVAEAINQSFQSKLWAWIREFCQEKPKDRDDAIERFNFIKSLTMRYANSASHETQQDETVTGLARKLIDDLGEYTKDPSIDEFAIAYSFGLLLLVAIIQVRCDADDGLPLVEAATSCAQEFLSSKPVAVPEGLVELVLQFCSKPESVFRFAAERLFGASAALLTADDLEPIFHVLEASENARGQSDLFKQGSEESESNEDDSSNDSVEEVDASGDASSSETSDDDEAASEDGDEASADEGLDNLLGQILQTRSLEPEEDDDNSDSDMTDSAMEAMQIDQQLSTIFKQRQSAGLAQSQESSKKRDEQDGKRNVVNFKTRALGLVSILTTESYASPAAAHCLLPLCQLIGSTRSAALSSKADDVLEKYIRLAKKKPHGLPRSLRRDAAAPETAPGSPGAADYAVVEALHAEALKWSSHLHASACSRAALFASRVIVEMAAAAASGSGDAAKGVAAARLGGIWEATLAQKQALDSGLPATFWDNWRGWLESMNLAA